MIFRALLVAALGFVAVALYECNAPELSTGTRLRIVKAMPSATPFAISQGVSEWFRSPAVAREQELPRAAAAVPVPVPAPVPAAPQPEPQPVTLPPARPGSDADVAAVCARRGLTQWVRIDGVRYVCPPGG